MVTFPELLVADTFQAECGKPKIAKARYEIVLERNATCIIRGATNDHELNLTRAKFQGWNINRSDRMSHPKQLLCTECKCPIKEKALYKCHTSADRVKPFPITRIERSPAICTKPTTWEAENYVELRSVIERES